MSDKKHTQKPWLVYAYGSIKPYIRIRGGRWGGRFKIANVHYERIPGMSAEYEESELAESLANAHLISAAPDMYDALKACLPLLGPGAVRAEVIAALAKADGEPYKQAMIEHITRGSGDGQ